MKKPLSILVLAIVLSSFDVSTPISFTQEDKINGKWEYQKVLIKGEWVDVATQNECGLRDVLEIKKTKEIEKYDGNNIRLKGYRAGISMARICTFDPVSFEPVIGYNACTMSWIILTRNPNRIVSLADALVIEYEITMPDNQSMILSKVREWENFGMEMPDKIELKRMNTN